MKLAYLIIFIFSSLAIFAQDYVPIDTAELSCTYFYDFQEDSLDPSLVKSEVMTLLIGRHSSLFSASNLLYQDSISMAHSNEPFNQSHVDNLFSQIQGRTTNRYCRYHLYNNYPAGSFLFTTYLNKKYLKVIDSNEVNWQIENNNDTIISGYKCLKASAELWNRKFIAWYTLEVPLSYGPYKFCGLPGLIVKVYDTEKQHCFTINSVKQIKEKQKAIYYKDKEYMTITAEEYTKSLEYYFADLYNRVSAGGVVTFDDDAKKARSLNNIRSRNNNIERY